MLIKYDGILHPYSSITSDCVLEVFAKGLSYKLDDYATTFLVKDHIVFFGLEELSSGKRTFFPGIQGFIPHALYTDVLTHMYNIDGGDCLYLDNMIFTTCSDGIEIEFLGSYPIGWSIKDQKVSSLRRCFISKSAVLGLTNCGNTLDINVTFSNGVLRLPSMPYAEREKVYIYLKTFMLS